MKTKTRFIKANTTIHRPKVDRNKLPLIPTKKDKILVQFKANNINTIKNEYFPNIQPIAGI